MAERNTSIRYRHLADTQTIEDWTSIIPHIMHCHTFAVVEPNPEAPLLPRDAVSVYYCEVMALRLNNMQRFQVFSWSGLLKLMVVFILYAMGRRFLPSGMIRKSIFFTTSGKRVNSHDFPQEYV